MIVLDTETTGLLRPSATELHLQPFMIEICAIKFDENFNRIGEVLTFVKPPVPIPDEIIKITNITNEMIQDAPAFPLIYDEMCDLFLGETEMYAHNCSFDANIICNELKRMGMEFCFPWPKKHVCTVEASMSIKNKRLKLADLYKIATGKDSFPDAHRAEADVLALVECVKFLKENEFV